MITELYGTAIQRLRNNITRSIRTAVSNHGFIGMYYKNVGHHATVEDQSDRYEETTSVVLHNPIYGFAEKTVMEIYVDISDNSIWTILKGTDDVPFTEPLESITIEGLCAISEWLIKNGFIEYVPYRCEQCGSLDVQRHIWVDSNSDAADDDYPCNRNEFFCGNCDEHTDQCRENELLETANSWWANLGFGKLEKITGYKPSDFAPDNGCQAFVDACNRYWEDLPIETKISLSYNN